jgi:hypothetical protein
MKSIKTIKRFVAIGTLLLTIALQQPLAAQNFSIRLDGVNDMVNLGGTVGNGVRTIEMWFQPQMTINNSLPTIATLIARNTDLVPTADEWGIYFRASSGRLVFFVRNGTVLHETETTTATWNAGTWYHVTAIIDTHLRIFINDVPDGVPFAHPGATSARPEDTRIGNWGDAAVNRYFMGRIENVRLWNIALNPTERNLYQCNTIGTTPGLIAEYLFNEQNGGATANNEVVANPDGTYLNGPTWVVDCPCTIAMDFRPNEWVDLGSDVGDNVASIEMLFKPNVTITAALATPRSLIVRNDGFEDEEFGLHFGNGIVGPAGELVFFLRHGGIYQAVTSGINTWNADQWYHVTATIDAAGMRLYINGTLVSGPAGHTTPTTAEIDILAIGCWGSDNSRFFDGQIENLRLWSRTLTPSEAMAHMCFEPVNYANIIAEYRFNEHHGSFVHDQWDPTAHNSGVVHGSRWLEYEFNCLHLERPTNIQTTEITESEFNIFPNPSSGSINIELGNLQPGDKKIEIYDALGKLVSQQDVSDTKDTIAIDLNEKGIYLVKVIVEGRVTTKKIIIQ